MNKSLFFILGISVGGAAGYFAPRPSDKTIPAELTQAKAEISKLQSQLSEKTQTVTKVAEPTPTATTEPAKEDGRPDMKKIMEDAKPLLKSLTSGFEPRRKEMMKRMVDEQVKRMTAAANLTPEQQASFKAYLEQMGAEEQAKWQNALDGKGGMEQLFQGGRGQNPQKAMEDWAQQNLTGDQATAYQTTRLTEKAKQVTDSANAQLDRMSSNLNLNETQKDQVFQILVQTDKNYAPTMKLEGVSTETPITGTKDEAIAAVLTPTQREQYEKQQQERQRRTGGFFKALGMDPANRP